MSANRNAGRATAPHNRRPPRPVRKEQGIESAVKSAIMSGFVIGREVFLDRVPGIVVAYNITSFGHFIGNAYPLVVRTAYGVTKCRMNDVSLA